MTVDEITEAVANHFLSYGGEKENGWPDDSVLIDVPLTFGHGVEIKPVVEFIIAQIEAGERKC